MNDSAERVATKMFQEDASETSPYLGESLGLQGKRGWGPERSLAPLLRTIEVEIIPRLILARRAMPDVPVVLAAGELVPSAQDVAELAGLILNNDAAAGGSFVEALRARGAPVEALYLELLAPVARRLGELWTEDLCDFTTVTVGLGRLQQILRELGPAFRLEAEHHEAGRHALLIPLPGEQHTFGLFMVAEFFRRASWDVWSGSVGSTAEVTRKVREEWFAMVGFSISSERGLDALATNIRAVRRASCNRAIGVMVGGPVFVEHPEYVALVGADATAVDGRQAVAQALNLVALLSRRC